MFTLHRQQVLPITPEEAWEFFSSPHNLGKITPPQMNFKILEQTGGDRMHPGQVIRYKITVLPLVRVTWVTEITDVVDGKSFTDQQVRGPYAHWKHVHHFEPAAGGVKMTDHVEYALPLGWLGRIARVVFVEREVNRIFDYRSKVLETYFRK